MGVGDESQVVIVIPPLPPPKIDVQKSDPRPTSSAWLVDGARKTERRLLSWTAWTQLTGARAQMAMLTTATAHPYPLFILIDLLDLAMSGVDLPAVSVVRGEGLHLES
jgi:hypothetical protein